NTEPNATAVSPNIVAGACTARPQKRRDMLFLSKLGTGTHATRKAAPHLGPSRSSQIPRGAPQKWHHRCHPVPNIIFQAFAVTAPHAIAPTPNPEAWAHKPPLYVLRDPSCMPYPLWKNWCPSSCAEMFSIPVPIPLIRLRLPAAL